MSKNFFHQDEWTQAFCSVFVALEEFGLIEKKGLFARRIGITDQSTLNHILNGERNMPLSRREQVMNTLHSIYKVNLNFFDAPTSSPMFLIDWSKNEEAAVLVREEGAQYMPPTGALKYREIQELKKAKEELETLKKILEEKERLIATQEQLINVLKSK